MTETHAPGDLVAHIAEKRNQVDTFISRALPRKQRLINVTIVSGTLAAALTAAPAAGGQTFTAWLTHTFGTTSPSWQILCGLASVCSIASLVATQLLKSHHMEEHVARAQSCRAKLEVLEIGLAAGQIEPSAATTEFIRCVEQASFL